MNVNSSLKWLQEFDHTSLGKFAVIDPMHDFDAISHDIPLIYNYIFSPDPTFFSLQRKILDFIQIFQQTFDELSSFPDESSQEFAKMGLLSLQCERYYLQETWKCAINTPNNSLMFQSLIAAFLRLKRLFYSLHKTLYKSESGRFGQFILWKNLQHSMQELVNALIKTLKGPIVVKGIDFDFADFMDIVKGFRHYVENFLKKTHDYLLQETINLYGEGCEKNILSRILNKDLSMSTNMNLMTKRPTNSTLFNDNNIDNDMKERILKGFSTFFKRESNFHELSELRLKNNEDPLEINRKKHLTSVFDGKVLENYPCLNDKMNENMNKILLEIESLDKFIKENSETMVRSVQNSRDFLEENKSENNSKSLSRNESLEEITIKSDNEENFRKISDLDAKIKSLQKEKPRMFNNKKPVNNNKFLISHSFQIEEKKQENTDKKSSFQKPSMQKSQDLAFTKNSHQGSLLVVPPSNFNNNKSEKKLRKQEKTMTNVPRSPRLNISARDLISIDSNTMISEELRHVEFIENDNGFSIRDCELFEFEIIKNTEKKKVGFLEFLENERSKEINRKNGVYFRFIEKNGNFIKKIQIQQEVQALLDKKRMGEKGYLERKGKIKGSMEWSLEEMMI